MGGETKARMSIEERTNKKVDEDHMKTRTIVDNDTSKMTPTMMTVLMTMLITESDYSPMVGCQQQGSSMIMLTMNMMMIVTSIVARMVVITMMIMTKVTMTMIDDHKKSTDP